MASLPTSLGLFRSLLRARSAAFKGDPTALTAARTEIRKNFDESKHLSPSEASGKIKEGVEAESFIRLHVVQAVGNERGNYEMTVQTHHTDLEGSNTIEVPSGGAGAAGSCAGEKK